MDESLNSQLIHKYTVSASKSREAQSIVEQALARTSSRPKGGSTTVIALESKTLSKTCDMDSSSVSSEEYTQDQDESESVSNTTNTNTLMSSTNTCSVEISTRLPEWLQARDHLQILNSRAFEWNPDRPLGKGAYGAVYLARYIAQPDKNCALKISSLRTKEKSQPKLLALAKREVALLQEAWELAPKYVVAYYHHWQEYTRNNNIPQFYILMEFAGTTPMDALLERNREWIATGEKKKYLDIGLPALLCVAEDVFRGLAHLHGGGLVHRDLKPANIMVVPGKGRIHGRLIDFGLALSFRPGLDDSVVRAECAKACGTPRYSSPEVAALALHCQHANAQRQNGGSVGAKKYLSPKELYAADVWSAGMCFLAQHTPRWPGRASIRSPEQLWRYVTKLQHPPRFNLTTPIDDECVPGEDLLKDIIEKCLELRVSKRANARDIVRLIAQEAGDE